MIKNITGKIDFIESLRGKKATFMLALSNTQTANIEGITQAGIPGKIYLTPTLDAEFLTTGEVRSLEDIAKTPKGVPTSINPSNSIDQKANIDAQSIFQQGIAFGQKYNCKDDYIILAESVPAGTTTAKATALALGYDCEKDFSSSFKNVPEDIREITIQNALKNIDKNDDIFKILGSVSDNMIIFNAGFILGLNNKIPLILAGGTQMACVLLVVNKILEVMNGAIETSNLALVTTSWIANDTQSDIKALLKMCSFPINSYYADFDFSLSNHPALKLYDDGEAKEGVGAGAALAYGLLYGLNKQQITSKIEEFLA